MLAKPLAASDIRKREPGDEQYDWGFSTAENKMLETLIATKPSELPRDFKPKTIVSLIEETYEKLEPASNVELQITRTRAAIVSAADDAGARPNIAAESLLQLNDLTKKSVQEYNKKALEFEKNLEARVTKYIQIEKTRKLNAKFQTRINNILFLVAKKAAFVGAVKFFGPMVFSYLISSGAIMGASQYLSSDLMRTLVIGSLESFLGIRPDKLMKIEQALMSLQDVIQKMSVAENPLSPDQLFQVAFGGKDPFLPGSMSARALATARQKTFTIEGQSVLAQDVLIQKYQAAVFDFQNELISAFLPQYMKDLLKNPQISSIVGNFVNLGTESSVVNSLGESGATPFLAAAGVSAEDQLKWTAFMYVLNVGNVALDGATLINDIYYNYTLEFQNVMGLIYDPTYESEQYVAQSTETSIQSVFQGTYMRQKVRAYAESLVDKKYVVELFWGKTISAGNCLGYMTEVAYNAVTNEISSQAKTAFMSRVFPGYKSLPPGTPPPGDDDEEEERRQQNVATFKKHMKEYAVSQAKRGLQGDGLVSSIEWYRNVYAPEEMLTKNNLTVIETVWRESYKKINNYVSTFDAKNVIAVPIMSTVASLSAATLDPRAFDRNLDLKQGSLKDRFYNYVGAYVNKVVIMGQQYSSVQVSMAVMNFHKAISELYNTVYEKAVRSQITELLRIDDFNQWTREGLTDVQKWVASRVYLSTFINECLQAVTNIFLNFVSGMPGDFFDIQLQSELQGRFGFDLRPGSYMYTSVADPHFFESYWKQLNSMNVAKFYYSHLAGGAADAGNFHTNTASAVLNANRNQFTALRKAQTIDDYFGAFISQDEYFRQVALGRIVVPPTVWSKDDSYYTWAKKHIEEAGKSTVGLIRSVQEVAGYYAYCAEAVGYQSVTALELDFFKHEERLVTDATYEILSDEETIIRLEGYNHHQVRLLGLAAFDRLNEGRTPLGAVDCSNVADPGHRSVAALLVAANEKYKTQYGLQVPDITTAAMCKEFVTFYNAILDGNIQARDEERIRALSLSSEKRLKFENMREFNTLHNIPKRIKAAGDAAAEGEPDGSKKPAARAAAEAMYNRLLKSPTFIRIGDKNYKIRLATAADSYNPDSPLESIARYGFVVEEVADMPLQITSFPNETEARKGFLSNYYQVQSMAQLAKEMDTIKIEGFEQLLKPQGDKDTAHIVRNPTLLSARIGHIIAARAFERALGVDDPLGDSDETKKKIKAFVKQNPDMARFLGKASQAEEQYLNARRKLEKTESRLANTPKGDAEIAIYKKFLNEGRYIPNSFFEDHMRKSQAELERDENLAEFYRRFLTLPTDESWIREMRAKNKAKFKENVELLKTRAMGLRDVLLQYQEKHPKGQPSDDPDSDENDVKAILAQVDRFCGAGASALCLNGRQLRSMTHDALLDEISVDIDTFSNIIASLDSLSNSIDKIDSDSIDFAIFEELRMNYDGIKTRMADSRLAENRLSNSRKQNVDARKVLIQGIQANLVVQLHNNVYGDKAKVENKAILYARGEAEHTKIIGEYYDKYFDLLRLDIPSIDEADRADVVAILRATSTTTPTATNARLDQLVASWRSTCIVLTPSAACTFKNEILQAEISLSQQLLAILTDNNKNAENFNKVFTRVRSDFFVNGKPVKDLSVTEMLAAMTRAEQGNIKVDAETAFNGIKLDTKAMDDLYIDNYSGNISTLIAELPSHASLVGPTAPKVPVGATDSDAVTASKNTAEIAYGLAARDKTDYDGKLASRTEKLARINVLNANKIRSKAENLELRNLLKEVVALDREIQTLLTSFNIQTATVNTYVNGAYRLWELNRNEGALATELSSLRSTDIQSALNYLDSVLTNVLTTKSDARTVALRHQKQLKGLLSHIGKIGELQACTSSPTATTGNCVEGFTLKEARDALLFWYGYTTNPELQTLGTSVQNTLDMRRRMAASMDRNGKPKFATAEQEIRIQALLVLADKYPGHLEIQVRLAHILDMIGGKIPPSLQARIDLMRPQSTSDVNISELMTALTIGLADLKTLAAAGSVTTYLDTFLNGIELFTHNLADPAVFTALHAKCAMLATTIESEADAAKKAKYANLFAYVNPLQYRAGTSTSMMQGLIAFIDEEMAAIESIGPSRMDTSVSLEERKQVEIALWNTYKTAQTAENFAKAVGATLASNHAYATPVKDRNHDFQTIIDYQNGILAGKYGPIADLMITYAGKRHELLGSNEITHIDELPMSAEMERFTAELKDTKRTPAQKNATLKGILALLPEHQKHRLTAIMTFLETANNPALYQKFARIMFPVISDRGFDLFEVYISSYNTNPENEYERIQNLRNMIMVGNYERPIPTRQREVALAFIETLNRRDVYDVDISAALTNLENYARGKLKIGEFRTIHKGFQTGWQTLDHKDAAADTLLNGIKGANSKGLKSAFAVFIATLPADADHTKQFQKLSADLLGLLDKPGFTGDTNGRRYVLQKLQELGKYARSTSRMGGLRTEIDFFLRTATTPGAIDAAVFGALNLTPLNVNSLITAVEQDLASLYDTSIQNRNTIISGRDAIMKQISFFRGKINDILRLLSENPALKAQYEELKGRYDTIIGKYNTQTPLFNYDVETYNSLKNLHNELIPLGTTEQNRLKAVEEALAEENSARKHLLGTQIVAMKRRVQELESERLKKIHNGEVTAVYSAAIAAAKKQLDELERQITNFSPKDAKDGKQQLDAMDGKLNGVDTIIRDAVGNALKLTEIPKGNQHIFRALQQLNVGLRYLSLRTQHPGFQDAYNIQIQMLNEVILHPQNEQKLKSAFMNAFKLYQTYEKFANQIVNTMEKRERSSEVHTSVMEAKFAEMQRAEAGVDDAIEKRNSESDGFSRIRRILADNMVVLNEMYGTYESPFFLKFFSFHDIAQSKKDALFANMPIVTDFDTEISRLRVLEEAKRLAAERQAEYDALVQDAINRRLANERLAALKSAIQQVKQNISSIQSAKGLTEEDKAESLRLSAITLNDSSPAGIQIAEQTYLDWTALLRKSISQYVDRADSLLKKAELDPFHTLSTEDLNALRETRDSFLSNLYSVRLAPEPIWKTIRLLISLEGKFARGEEERLAQRRKDTFIGLRQIFIRHKAKHPEGASELRTSIEETIKDMERESITDERLKRLARLLRRHQIKDGVEFINGREEKKATEKGAAKRDADTKTAAAAAEQTRYTDALKKQVDANKALDKAKQAKKATEDAYSITFVTISREEQLQKDNDKIVEAESAKRRTDAKVPIAEERKRNADEAAAAAKAAQAALDSKSYYSDDELVQIDTSILETAEGVGTAFSLRKHALIGFARHLPKILTGDKAAALSTGRAQERLINSVKDEDGFDARMNELVNILKQYGNTDNFKEIAEFQSLYINVDRVASYRVLLFQKKNPPYESGDHERFLHIQNRMENEIRGLLDVFGTKPFSEYESYKKGFQKRFTALDNEYDVRVNYIEVNTLVKQFETSPYATNLQNNPHLVNFIRSLKRQLGEIRNVLDQENLNNPTAENFLSNAAALLKGFKSDPTYNVIRQIVIYGERLRVTDEYIGIIQSTHAAEAQAMRNAIDKQIDAFVQSADAMFSKIASRRIVNVEELDTMNINILTAITNLDMQLLNWILIDTNNGVPLQKNLDSLRTQILQLANDVEAAVKSLLKRVEAAIESTKKEIENANKTGKDVTGLQADLKRLEALKAKLEGRLSEVVAHKQLLSTLVTTALAIQLATSQALAQMLQQLQQTMAALLALQKALAQDEEELIKVVDKYEQYKPYYDEVHTAAVDIFSDDPNVQYRQEETYEDPNIWLVWGKLQSVQFSGAISEMLVYADRKAIEITTALTGKEYKQVFDIDLDKILGIDTSKHKLMTITRTDFESKLTAYIIQRKLARIHPRIPTPADLLLINEMSGNIARYVGGRVYGENTAMQSHHAGEHSTTSNVHDNFLKFLAESGSGTSHAEASKIVKGFKHRAGIMTTSILPLAMAAAPVAAIVATAVGWQIGILQSASAVYVLAGAGATVAGTAFGIAGVGLIVYGYQLMNYAYERQNAAIEDPNISGWKKAYVVATSTLMASMGSVMITAGATFLVYVAIPALIPLAIATSVLAFKAFLVGLVTLGVTIPVIALYDMYDGGFRIRRIWNYVYFNTRFFFNNKYVDVANDATRRSLYESSGFNSNKASEFQKRLTEELERAKREGEIDSEKTMETLSQDQYDGLVGRVFQIYRNVGEEPVEGGQRGGAMPIDLPVEQLRSVKNFLKALASQDDTQIRSLFQADFPESEAQQIITSFKELGSALPDNLDELLDGNTVPRFSKPYELPEPLKFLETEPETEEEATAMIDRLANFHEQILNAMSIYTTDIKTLSEGKELMDYAQALYTSTPETIVETILPIEKEATPLRSAF